MLREMLLSKGYRVFSDCYGYSVFIGETYIMGASILGRPKMHWQHARQNSLDNTRHAWRVAEYHYYENCNLDVLSMVFSDWKDLPLERKAEYPPVGPGYDKCLYFDRSYYQLAVLNEIKSKRAVSIHVWNSLPRYDKRWILRMGGQPKWRTNEFQ